MNRVWEPFPPLRVAGILPAIRGRDALDTKEQGQGVPNAKYRIGEPQDALATKAAFSLLDTPAPESLAKRRWSASYLALVQATERTLDGHRYLAGVSGDLVNWVSAQSGPEMLPPYAAGAARSRLLPLLTEGHYGVRVTPEEIETLACWIDLQVPFCGDYEEKRDSGGSPVPALGAVAGRPERRNTPKVSNSHCPYYGRLWKSTVVSSLPRAGSGAISKPTVGASMLRLPVEPRKGES
jgi:hypothetical protein